MLLDLAKGARPFFFLTCLQNCFDNFYDVVLVGTYTLHITYLHVRILIFNNTILPISSHCFSHS